MVVDCHDPAALASFWCAALGYRVLRTEDHEVEIGLSEGPPAPALVLLRAPDGKVVKNRLHLDLRPVRSTIDAEVERLLALGARRADIGQGEVAWTVLADPEGNEFCVLAPLDDG